MGQPDYEFLRKILASGTPQPLPKRPSGLLSDMLNAENLTTLSSISSLFAPQPEPKPDGIWFYRDGGDKVKFMEPSRFSWGIPQPAWAGLYAILVADNTWKPRFFRPVYFGETENLAERPSTSHEHYDDWCKAAGGAGNLYVAYHWMMSSTKEERTAIESGLIKHYQPECNTQYRYTLSWLARAIQSSAVPGAPARTANSDYASLLEAVSRSFK